MKLKMAKNSLFAILLRSSWWISIAIAALLTLGALAILPDHVDMYAFSAGLPFLVVGLIAAYRQLRAPSPARVQSITEDLGNMSWTAFADAIEAAYRRSGHSVTRLSQPPADFEVAREGKRALLSCKRWKASSHGVEPLRTLHAAGQASGVSETVYVSVGALSENAARFAAQNNIRLIQGVALAQLLDPVLPRRKS